MEKFDLYDINRIKKGEIIDRGCEIPENRYRCVVHIVVFNSKGEMLIQQRASQKSSHANKWDFSVGGCVRAGETSNQGAERELAEEIGLKADFSHKQPSITINFGCGFDDYYVTHFDIDPKDVVLQEDEVQAVKWATKEEIKKLIDEGNFIGYRKIFVDFLFDFCRKEYGTFDR